MWLSKHAKSKDEFVMSNPVDYYKNSRLYYVPDIWYKNKFKKIWNAEALCKVGILIVQRDGCILDLEECGMCVFDVLGNCSVETHESTIWLGW